MFWSNIYTNQIHRASLEDGSDAAVIVDSGMLRPGNTVYSYIAYCHCGELYTIREQTQ